MVAGTTSGGGFWTLLPGSVVWGLFGVATGYDAVEFAGDRIRSIVGLFA